VTVLREGTGQPCSWSRERWPSGWNWWPGRAQQVLIAGGQRIGWPVAEVRLALNDQDVTTPCFIAPDGPALLGAVALESLFLAVDPVAKRLIPVEGFVG
jgi:hypothetical protein